jgi:hypothetical protein
MREQLSASAAAHAAALEAAEAQAADARQLAGLYEQQLAEATAPRGRRKGVTRVGSPGTPTSTHPPARAPVPVDAPALSPGAAVEGKGLPEVMALYNDMVGGGAGGPGGWAGARVWG